MLCDVQFSTDLFHPIKVLEVVDYYGGSVRFPISFLKRFYNLEILQIYFFDFKDGVCCGGDIAKNLDAETAPSRIRELKLSNCRNLTHILKKGPELGYILPNLEALEVSWCEDLINFGSFLSSLQNLTALKVDGCHMMINLVTPSIAQSLVRLTEMRILNCSVMKEIVANSEGDEATYDITFSKLKYLKLESLRSLESFCPGNHDFNFSSLEELIVKECPRLRVFCKGVLNTPKLQRVKKRDYDDTGCWGGDLNTTVQQMYTQKVGYCDHLILSDMFPEVMKIWNTNPQATLDFERLREMEVCNCSSLKYIFIPSMALSLKSLDTLMVKECNNMEVVLREQGVEEGAVTDKFFTFPNLCWIEIKSCSNFTCFYLGSKALQFPLLEGIRIVDCPRMITFASSYSRDKDKETIGEGDLNIIASSFFSGNKVVHPELKILELSSINIEKIWDLRQLTSSFYAQNLVLLTIKGCHNLKYLFPSFIIKQFVQLKKLHISGCKMMEEVIFFMEGLTEDERMSQRLFPKLEFLFLEDLPKLTRFCYGIHNEFPSLPPFKNLKTLEVSRCHGLFNLIACSVAKSLTLLEEMSITDCEMIEQIIACEGEEIKGGIVFTRLKSLQLSCLPSLTSFSSRDHIFEFLVLEKVIARECPKMKIFSEGDLSTPKLKRVQVTGDKDNQKRWRWDGDLNTTIQELFKETNVENSGLS